MNTNRNDEENVEMETNWEVVVEEQVCGWSVGVTDGVFCSAFMTSSKETAEKMSKDASVVDYLKSGIRKARFARKHSK